MPYWKKQQKGYRTMYETINSPINYGGLELKNRIIFAPTTFGLAEDEYFEKIDPPRRPVDIVKRTRSDCPYRRRRSDTATSSGRCRHPQSVMPS